MKQVKDAVGTQAAHLEPAKGTIEENVKYCSKDETSVAGTRFEKGTRPKEQDASLMQNQFAEMKQTITEGGKLQDVIEQHFELAIKYGNGLLRAMHYLQKPPMRRSIVNIAIIGPTGVGKSNWICDNFDPDEVYEKDKSDWWDGYNGEKVIVFNDYYGEHSYSKMLNWMDIYRCQVPVKGGYVWLRHSVCVFTSNMMPDTWYAELFRKEPAAKNAWYRRLPQSNILCVGSRADFKPFSQWEYFTLAPPREEPDAPPPAAPPASPAALMGDSTSTDGGVILEPTVGTSNSEKLAALWRKLDEDREKATEHYYKQTQLLEDYGLGEKWERMVDALLDDDDDENWSFNKITKQNNLENKSKFFTESDYMEHIPGLCMDNIVEWEAMHRGETETDEEMQRYYLFNMRNKADTSDDEIDEDIPLDPQTAWMRDPNWQAMMRMVRQEQTFRFDLEYAENRERKLVQPGYKEQQEKLLLDYIGWI